MNPIFSNVHYILERSVYVSKLFSTSYLLVHQVPVFLGGAFSRWFQRVVIVLQLVEAPWATIPDWRGTTLLESEVIHLTT